MGEGVCYKQGSSCNFSSCSTIQRAPLIRKPLPLTFVDRADKTVSRSAATAATLRDSVSIILPAVLYFMPLDAL